MMPLQVAQIVLFHECPPTSTDLLNYCVLNITDRLQKLYMFFCLFVEHFSESFQLHPRAFSVLPSSTTLAIFLDTNERRKSALCINAELDNRVAVFAEQSWITNFELVEKLMKLGVFAANFYLHYVYLMNKINVCNREVQDHEIELPRRVKGKLYSHSVLG